MSSIFCDTTIIATVKALPFPPPFELLRRGFVQLSSDRFFSESDETSSMHN
ncbi:hypothetical protein IQ255_23845 [Pleurocapsales cyanobacterium LEGE 10410]|nr:hypothetical protein [Pleurocapsales cyanobacterium LEGE 10410]